MAVYTHVGDDDLRKIVAEYDIGTPLSLIGVAQGVENSNYILTTTHGQYVLTLFERRVEEHDLPFYIATMAHMSKRGLPAPSPVKDRAGEIFRRVCGRPAVIVTFLNGAPRSEPSLEDCRRMGAMNAQLRVAAAGFNRHRANALSHAGWRRLASQCQVSADSLAPGLANLIDDEVEFLGASMPGGLPRGVVHADLFPDNVFFERGEITGIIDFYFACTDYFAYDLAITINAWSSRGGDFLDQNAKAMLDGYQSIVPLSEAERAAMPALLRGAALRFLLTRLYDWINQVDGAVVAVKDPLEYRALLSHHRGGATQYLFG